MSYNSQHLRHPIFRSAISTLFLGLLLCAAPAAAQEVENPPDPVAIFNQAQDLHEKGDLAAAIALYENALKIEPAFPEAVYQRGIAQLALGKRAEAEISFRRALELRTDWVVAMTSLGSLLVDRGDTAEAQKLLNKVLETEPNNAVALIAIADLSLSTKATHSSLEDVLARISALTAKSNATAAIWSARAALENALLRRSLAKLSLAKALAVDPNNRNALFLTAEIAIAEGDIAKAESLVARLRGDAETDALRIIRARILAAKGEAAEAIAILDSVKVQSAPSNELRSQLAVAGAASSAELEKLLEKNPKSSAILGRLCSLYRRENPAKALDYCRKASEAEPSNANHAIGFGAALVQARKFDAAIGIFRKILEIVPDNATARANLATALFQLKRYDEAETELLWLTKAQPKSAGPYLFLGIIYDETAEYVAALANYEQYVRLADPVENKLDLEKVNLRLPSLRKLAKDGKGKRK